MPAVLCNKMAALAPEVLRFEFGNFEVASVRDDQAA